IIKLLLNFNADTSLKTSPGWTALHMACERGRKDAVEVLLAAGAPVNSAGGDVKHAPLHLAVLNEHKEVVSHLITHGKGININQKDSIGHTPLHVAAQFNVVEIGQMLILHGAE
ncbi:ankyrin, partial [Cadophora sp. DSE1049]